MNLNTRLKVARSHYILSVPTVLPNWRGHQTSQTVVSLKGRLLQTFLSKSTFSCESVQIHSLFRHGFINKPK